VRMVVRSSLGTFACTTRRPYEAVIIIVIMTIDARSVEEVGAGHSSKAAEVEVNR